MKKLVYQTLYNLLLVISNHIDNRYVNKYKMLLGSSLLILTSCQYAKKTEQANNREFPDSIIEKKTQNNDADTIITDSINPQLTKKDSTERTTVMCYFRPPDVSESHRGKNDPYDVVDSMPEFPGGNEKLIKFITNNLVFPKELQEAAPCGRVIVGFVVERDGSISDIKVLRSVDPYMDKAALDVIAKMPKWKPGRLHGEPVRVKYTIPVNFHSQL